ncbi:hypothetical protein D1007_00430 [Hordeum vulgare]|nr:hypothetical protein D1007_00430 [Hordeum vulgare]
MAPTIKKRTTTTGAQLEPALLKSTINNQEGLNKSMGCASFRMVHEMAKKIINMKIMKKVEGFRSRWVCMDVGHHSPLLQLSFVPIVKSSGWEHSKINDVGLAPFIARIQELRDTGLTGVMVAKEFVRRCTTPIHKHSHPAWA